MTYKQRSSLPIPMRDLLPFVATILVILAIPIVPFLLGGEAIEQRVRQWLEEQSSPATLASGVVLLLSSDIFLPIPSSAVSTLAGNALGFWAGTAASWLGMTCGSLVGFALARRFGKPVVRWLAKPEVLDRVQRLAARYGREVLIVSRPVPVLAEASVLFLGMAGLAWARLWAPLLLSNLGIAMAYSALGHWVQLPVALAASLGLPLLASLLAKRFLPG